MCTNQREITNKFTGHKLYVKCGHCPACLQEKAVHRVSRIKAEDSPYTDTIMCTLTYKRHNCPYVFRDEAYSFSKGLPLYSDRFTKTQYICSLPIYRDVSYRKVRSNSDYDIINKCTTERVCIGSIEYDKKCSFCNNKDLAHENNKIGVAFYPDVQRFIARLRLNLIRNFNYHGKFKIYCTSEYGSKSLRPHFHLLFWIQKGTFETFRSAIAASWPFSDISKFERSVEKAFRASSYVASYVNCSNDFPDFLKTYFKPKHSYSKDFGVNADLFQLLKVLEKFRSGHLTYFAQKEKQSVPFIVECPIPKYIICRYFPLFKGYNRFTSTQRVYIAKGFKELSGISKSNIKSDVNLRLYFDKVTFPVYYTDDDLHKIAVRLDNAYKRFLIYACENISFDDYIDLHGRIWNLYYSDILRLHLTNEDIPICEKYDNLQEIKCKVESDLDKYKNYPLPIGFSRDMLLVTDPNKFTSVRINTARFSQSYYDHIKHRGVCNSVLSSLYEEF